jgi:predicted membrane-bound spermidine synthase
VLKGNKYLFLTVFISGMTVLGVELSASRLLAPFFGNSLIIWANLIGLILIYLSLGYWLGGRWADRDPRGTTFFQIIAWGAFLVGLIPSVSRPILNWSLQGFATLTAGIMIGSLLGVLILFSVPMILLAMASPFAIRLAVTHVEGSGKIAGSIYALSTLGSILGTFLPVLILIPNIGTRRTFLLFSAVLLIIAIGGLFQNSKLKGCLYLLLLVLLIAHSLFWKAGLIKATPNTIFETESRYNYIQVEKDGDDISLRLNEGIGIHSIYRPNHILVSTIWDYFLLVPYFNPPPVTPDKIGGMLLIGSATGTVPKMYTAIFGPLPIDGVEIDPAISKVGRRFFAMNEPNLTTFNQDGRYFITHTDKCYHVIGVDAYRTPYIPFQLTTQEFFQEIYDHLNVNGITVVNAARSDTDYSLVVALGSTMKSSFSSVFVIDEPCGDLELGNSLVIATKQPAGLTNLVENATYFHNRALIEVWQRALNSRIWEISCQPGRPFIAGIGDLPLNLPEECPPPFTDDKAPVEQVIHNLILRFMLGK